MLQDSIFNFKKILDETRNDYKVINRYSYENVLLFTHRKYPNKTFSFNFCTMFFYELDCRAINNLVCYFNLKKVGYEIPSVFISYTFSKEIRKDGQKGEILRRQKYFDFRGLNFENKNKSILKPSKHKIRNSRLNQNKLVLA